MICPNCLKKVSQEVIKCPNCKFDLSNAFDEFYKREKRIHNKVRRIRINQDKKVFDERIKLTDYMFSIASGDLFNHKLDAYGISGEEWNCLQFRLISRIYLEEITKKAQVNENLNRLLESYDGEYKFKLDILSKNLTNLINLAGINPFSRYYLYQLNDHRLSIVEGLEVLGRVIDDLLYGEIRLEDLDEKIKSFMEETVSEPARLEYENGLNKAIDEYFSLTGRDYFSIYFENKLLDHEFTLDDAYLIKEMFLKKIIVDNARRNLKAKLNSIVHSYFTGSTSGPKIAAEDSIRLEGDAYAYYDTLPKSNGLKRKRTKRKSEKNKDDFIKIQSEELGSDDGSYDDHLDFEREILGDF